jgi:predicted HicB family RNase H-like nuclease
MEKYNYSYLVKPIRDEDEIIYQAIIPQFPKLLVFADTILELEEAVMLSIEEDLKDRKKSKIPTPEEDTKSNFNGKILVRVDPIIHERLSLLAQANQTSLNKFIAKGLEKLTC